tara:strand:- start:300 stop:488 length:189 start_codon:yes stop_codon:yes gene_type:complete
VKPLSKYDLSTIHYLCSYYKDNANLDFEDWEYIDDLQHRVSLEMELEEEDDYNPEFDAASYT